MGLIKLSLIIRCCNDWRIFECIRSIDENIEVIVSICHGKKIIEKLRKLQIKYVISPHGNLSTTSNNGLKLTSFEKIIITDSDTKFKKTAIRRVYDALDEYDFVSMRIDFEFNSAFSKLVAKARQYVNSKPVIFTPGIGFRKSSIEKIGGYLFDPKVPFAVDAELTFRIKYYKLKYTLLNEAEISHNSELLRHDLKAAYRIGKGCKKGETILRSIYATNSSYHNFTNYNLKAVRFNDYTQITKSYGFGVLLYQIVWDFLFYIGYFSKINEAL